MSPSLALLASLALILGACQAPAASDSQDGLRPITLALGYRPDVQFAPFYVAQREGFYADAGLDVTIEHHPAPDVQRLVADGQAQFGVADATDVMIARTAGIPIRYVSTLYQRFPVALIGDAADVPSDPAGLSGMTIGTPGKFGSSWHALLALLEAGGLTEDDVTVRDIRSSTRSMASQTATSSSSPASATTSRCGSKREGRRLACSRSTTSRHCPDPD
jgi:NitT/TauT family transport system substrate-binding protein